jgi:hypothetical protein
MYSRLTTEGRSVTWFFCKVIAWGSAITLGTTGIVAAGESIGRPISEWWQSATAFSPSRTVMAAPAYYAPPPVQSPSPATLQFHFQPISVQQSYPARTYAPGYIFPGHTWLQPVRVMSSGYRPPSILPPGYQYWRYGAMYPGGQGFRNNPPVAQSHHG